MLKPQFAPLVESGSKRQTVGPTPKRMPKPGDRISLRTWTGKPWRSKHRALREARIAAVERIAVCDTGRELLVSIGGKSLTPEELNAFAAAEGFNDGIELFNWLETGHGLPFEGVVIKWRNDTSSAAGARGLDAPVRLCCGERHFGPVCPDGTVMCCLCFERAPQDELNAAANGEKEDVCKKCAAEEGASNARTEPPPPTATVADKRGGA